MTKKAIKRRREKRREAREAFEARMNLPGGDRDLTPKEIEDLKKKGLL